jgi:GNAT superfamily N-acetyltransferase
MSVRVHRFSDPQAFKARAEPWLLEREAEHTLVLGIADQLIRGDHDYGEPVYLATVEEDGALVGAVFRTPPHKLGVTRLPEYAVDAVAEDVAAVFDAVPAVIGHEETAVAIAAAWCERRGTSTRLTMRMRIHALDALRPPERPAPGRFRLAGAEDLPLLRDWHLGFERDTHVPLLSHPDQILGRIEAGSVGVWEDGAPRAMACAVGPSRNTIRIGGVYTPPRWRGRGYGSAVTAAISQLSLDRGYSTCVLYTDLANPTSNRIYAALGYVPVADVVDLALEMDPARAGAGGPSEA